MRYLRYFLLALSLQLLGFSVWAWNHREETGLSILDPEFFKHVESPEEERAETMAYADRIRTDAYERVAQGDYENALVRLDQAAHYDPQTNMTRPEVRHARAVIAQNLGTSAAPPSPSASASAAPGASTAPSTATSARRAP